MLLTAAVLLPAAVAGTRAGLEFLHPLAVTMLGGLVSLLVVQVFVLPAFLMTTARPHAETGADEHRARADRNPHTRLPD